MSDQMTFKRYEVKYMLTARQRNALLEAMEGRQALDQYGRHTIRNIYFDTSTFRLVRDSIEKPLYKEKLRVRSYGRAAEDSHINKQIDQKTAMQMMPGDGGHVILMCGAGKNMMQRIFRELF